MADVILITAAGAAEAMALAQLLGLHLGRTLDVIEQSSGQSWIGSDRMRRAIAGGMVSKPGMSSNNPSIASANAP